MNDKRQMASGKNTPAPLPRETIERMLNLQEEKIKLEIRQT